MKDFKGNLCKVFYKDITVTLYNTGALIFINLHLAQIIMS